MQNLVFYNSYVLKWNQSIVFSIQSIDFTKLQFNRFFRVVLKISIKTYF